jgi:hypothetical protein
MDEKQINSELNALINLLENNLRQLVIYWRCFNGVLGKQVEWILKTFIQMELVINSICNIVVFRTCFIQVHLQTK